MVLRALRSQLDPDPHLRDLATAIAQAFEELEGLDAYAAGSDSGRPSVRRDIASRHGLEFEEFDALRAIRMVME